MQVNANLNAGLVARMSKNGPGARVPTPADTGPSFQSSEALFQAVKQLPVARPEEVSRAKTLLADGNYPPKEAIRKISELLAMNLPDDNVGDVGGSAPAAGPEKH